MCRILHTLLAHDGDNDHLDANVAYVEEGKYNKGKERDDNVQARPMQQPSDAAHSQVSGGSPPRTFSNMSSWISSGRAQVVLLGHRLWDLGRSCRRYGGRIMVVVICQVLFALRTLVLHRDLVRLVTIILCVVGGVMSLRCSARVLGGILAPFFSLLAFHLGLFKESSFLCKPLPLLTVFCFVLADQGLWGCTKNALVLAKLTDPKIFLAWRMMVVLKLLLQTSLPSSYCSLLCGRASRSPRLCRSLRLIGHCRTCLRSLR